MISNHAKSALNQQVANYGVLFVKLHNYHWYIKGPDFLTLHEKLEELYTWVSEQYDVVAERLLMNNGTPSATLKEYLEQTTLEEAKSGLSADEMIDSVIKDFQQVRKEMLDAIEHLEAQDVTVEDDLLGQAKEIEKQIWMLRATLKK
ncbi:DNA starvation/stationary phase protection protein [Exiguobacterium sp. Leaf187]|jgi:starvation-inducible DNA-binding protein|uniref:DNA starvation/stationary phase protection protein n=2 Tax=Exiguobacterium TaxID=33986 RepID=A0A0V8GJ51_9BACL|nr:MULTISPECIES: DNA starvation/stationary phase protection protein [Exiguobacterium]AHA30459.1 general stress protein [Exiguobacterium sp. MH3]AOT01423.1 DNA starvation/stationary phase protection protein [Exiguobacterium sp. U13-1]EZP60462.1 Ferritin Dps family protein [Exiguobacterium sp. RIT341]KNH32784.1 general stress protein [Exiguobacterium acetylicum]KQS19692.1 DNA starvation/stationary phase protection protein [Exiguobacterium sp. Leaf187]